MQLPTYELPPMYEHAGASKCPWLESAGYAVPLESAGCPEPPTHFVGCPDLAIAGALFAHRSGENYPAIAAYLDARAGELVAGFSPWPEEAITGSFFGSIAHAVSNTVSQATHPLANLIQPAASLAKTVTHVATAPLAKLAQPASSLAKTVAHAVTTPVTHAAAALVHGVRQLNPAAIAQMAAIKAKALAGSIKDSVVFHVLRTVTEKQFAPALAVIRSVSPALPYVQTVISFVPGVGSGVSAALGAAQALADGRPISDAAIAAVRGAIPGGPMAQMAFDTVWGLANGRSIDTALFSALRERIPGELAKRAADTALALATAKSAQDRKRILQGAAVQAALSQTPALPGVPQQPALPQLPGGLPRLV